MIKLQVIGNLGKDCVVNTVNGKTVINFSVAHTEKFRDQQGNQKDKTIWVECAYWTDRTAVSPYLTKGKTVYVEGQPEVRTYTTSDVRQGASITFPKKTAFIINLLPPSQKALKLGSSAMAITRPAPTVFTSTAAEFFTPS